MTQTVDVRELLERMAFDHAADGVTQVTAYGCRICSVPVGSWQAEMIRKAAGVHAASNPQELRDALQNPDIPVIFLPQSALVTPSAIERSCQEGLMNKVIIRETA